MRKNGKKKKNRKARGTSMTIKQITEITSKSEDTVLRRIKKILPSKEVLTGVPIDLTEFESYRVLKSFHSGFDLRPPQNAERPPQNAELLLAAAKMILQLRLAKKPDAIDFVLSEYLGYVVNDKPALPQPEKKTVYLPSLPTKDEQTDMIVGRRVRAKQSRKIEDHLSQIRLFGDNS